MSPETDPVVTENESELIEVVSQAIDERYCYDWINTWDSRVPIECRVVQYAYTVCGFAETNGYVAYMMMSSYHRALPICLRTLELPDLAALIDQMLDRVPLDGVLGSEEALVHYFGSWEKFANWVGQFEDRLFAAYGRIKSALASYCRTHATSLAHLDPRVTELFAVQGQMPGR
ncbi:MAG: hypothetical protein JNN17_12130 [Verrucomicrobiaceae bacterium]|nr:hypothetical protein [Verrucomicrobiaceae bacterium]